MWAGKKEARDGSLPLSQFCVLHGHRVSCPLPKAAKALEPTLQWGFHIPNYLYPSVILNICFLSTTKCVWNLHRGFWSNHALYTLPKAKRRVISETSQRNAQSSTLPEFFIKPDAKLGKCPERYRGVSGSCLLREGGCSQLPLQQHPVFPNPPPLQPFIG